MILIDTITTALQNSIKTVKKVLLGEFTYDDLHDVLQGQQPRSLRDVNEYALFGYVLSNSPDLKKELKEKKIVVRDYGLIGWLLSLNTAIIHATDTKASKALLQTIDNMPNARRPFNQLEITSITTLPSLFGEHGRRVHQEFMRIMPKGPAAVKQAIVLTRDLLEQWSNDSIYTLIRCDENNASQEGKKHDIHLDSKTGDFFMWDQHTEKWIQVGSFQTTIHDEKMNHPDCKKSILAYARKHRIIPKQIDSCKILYQLPPNVLNDLIENIMISLLIDEDKTQDTRLLIKTMQNSRNNPSQKERYQILLKSIIEHCLIHKKHLTPQTSLHQAIQAAQTENITELTHNQLICSIFSALAALDNVQQALHTAATLYSNYDSIRTTLAHTIQSLDLAFTESEEINNSLLFNKIQENKTLTLFFQDALRVSQFQPKHLPRYLSQPITHDNVTIPAGTNVFIVHRAQEASRDQYAPIFMNNKNAPMLKTTEAAAFSYGNRSCPGNKLTEYVFKSVVAVFIDFMTKNLSLSTTNNSEPSTPRSMR